MRSALTTYQTKKQTNNGKSNLERSTDPNTTKTPL